MKGRAQLSGLLTLALTISVSAPAKAGYVTGNDLFSDCGADRSDNVYYQKSARCTGYIVGALDALEIDALLRGRPTCISARVTVGQLRDIVMAYLTKNPQDRHMDASALVAVAINDAFQCSFLRSNPSP